jgi:sarcosine oxidase subunit beta
LVNSNESDVLVIGGGICGVATAFHLAQLDQQVTVLERGELASEASGVNAGGLGGLGWGNNPDLQSYLTAGSFEIFKTLQLNMGYDIEFHAPGGLQGIHTENQWDWVRDRVHNYQMQGYHAELLTSRETRAMEPEASESILGFMYLSKRGKANPTKATVAFGDAATALGAVIKTGHNVEEMTQQQDGSWQVQTNQGEFRAKTLVLAVGAWSRPLGDMIGIEIPVAPVKGQMWATAPVSPSLYHLSGSMESAFDWSKQSSDDNFPPEITHRGETRVTRHLYGGQSRNGEIIYGGDRQLVGYDYTPDATGIEVNRGQASEIIPLVGKLPIVRTWAGIMPFSMDSKPIIGKIPQFDNLFVLTGLASSGFGRGPMSGKLLADYIHTGHPASVLSESDPARCVILK